MISKSKVPFAIKFNQYVWDNTFQTWVKRIYLYGDAELVKLSDWSVGFYYCESCKAIKGFSYQLPPKGGISKEAHNDWVDFLHTHAHGDGRPLLFERKI